MAARSPVKLPFSPWGLDEDEEQALVLGQEVPGVGSAARPTEKSEPHGDR